MIYRIIIQDRIFNIKNPEHARFYLSGELARSEDMLSRVYAKIKTSNFSIDYSSDAHYFLENIKNSQTESLKLISDPSVMLTIPDEKGITPIVITYIAENKLNKSLDVEFQYYPSVEAWNYAFNRYLKTGLEGGLIMEAKN